LERLRGTLVVVDIEFPLFNAGKSYQSANIVAFSAEIILPTRCVSSLEHGRKHSDYREEHADRETSSTYMLPFRYFDKFSSLDHPALEPSRQPHPLLTSQLQVLKILNTDLLPNDEVQQKHKVLRYGASRRSALK
jgi:hypothetical protein